jgi:hypothetical protein
VDDTGSSHVVVQAGKPGVELVRAQESVHSSIVSRWIHSSKAEPIAGTKRCKPLRIERWRLADRALRASSPMAAELPRVQESCSDQRRACLRRLHQRACRKSHAPASRTAPRTPPLPPHAPRTERGMRPSAACRPWFRPPRLDPIYPRCISRA